MAHTTRCSLCGVLGFLRESLWPTQANTKLEWATVGSVYLPTQANTRLEWPSGAGQLSCPCLFPDGLGQLFDLRSLGGIGRSSGILPRCGNVVVELLREAIQLVCCIDDLLMDLSVLQRRRLFLLCVVGRVGLVDFLEIRRTRCRVLEFEVLRRWAWRLLRSRRERGGAEKRGSGEDEIGGAVTGIFGVGCVQLILRHTRLREDAAIGIVLSVFFGFGVVLLSYIQVMKTGNQGGLKSFIYGQTAAMSGRSIRITEIVETTMLIGLSAPSDLR